MGGRMGVKFTARVLWNVGEKLYDKFKKSGKINGKDFKEALKDEGLEIVENFQELFDGDLSMDDVWAITDLVAGFKGDDIAKLEKQLGKLTGKKFDKKEITKDFQDHHIISDKNKLTRDHELLELSGGNKITKKYGKKEYTTYDNLQGRNNKIYLPKDGSSHPTRSIHNGKHTTKVSERMEEEMSKVRDLGKQNNWTTEQYNKALNKIKMDERIELKNGSRALNKNKREGAE